MAKNFTAPQRNIVAADKIYIDTKLAEMQLVDISLARDRATHTGTQTINTINLLQGILDEKETMVGAQAKANTAQSTAIDQSNLYTNIRIQAEKDGIITTCGINAGIRDEIVLDTVRAERKDYIYYMARSQATSTAPVAITGGTVYEYVFKDGATTSTIYRYVSTAVNSRGYPDDWLYSGFVNPTLSGLLAKLIP